MMLKTPWAVVEGVRRQAQQLTPSRASLMDLRIGRSAKSEDAQITLSPIAKSTGH